LGRGISFIRFDKFAASCIAGNPERRGGPTPPSTLPPRPWLVILSAAKNLALLRVNFEKKRLEIMNYLHNNLLNERLVENSGRRYVPPAQNIIVQEEVMSHRANRWKSILIIPALGVLLMAGGVARTQASDRDHECDQRIHKAEDNLRKAVDKHGERSGQAEKRRHELEQAKRDCGRDHDHDRR
jgi:hypothetical protein